MMRLACVLTLLAAPALANPAAEFGQICLATAPGFERATAAAQSAGFQQNSGGTWQKGSLYAGPVINLSGSDGRACSVFAAGTKPKAVAEQVQQVLGQYGARGLSGKRRGVRTVFKFVQAGRDMTLKVGPSAPNGTSITLLESRFNVKDFK